MIEIIKKDDGRLFYDGRTWHRSTTSKYYFASIKHLGDVENISLHKYIYRKFYGDIPDGYDIHHIDLNYENNQPDNLVAMPRNEHRRMHQLLKIGLSPADFNGMCIQCHQNPIPSDKPWAIFCSSACKQVFARAQGRYNIIKACEMCGDDFVTNKYRTAKVCSACKQLYLKTMVQSGKYGREKICPVCNKPFRTIHNAITHPECRAKYNTMKAQAHRAENDVRICQLEGCNNILSISQDKFCCMEHSNEWQHRQAEKRKLGALPQFSPDLTHRSEKRYTMRCQSIGGIQ